MRGMIKSDYAATQVVQLYTNSHSSCLLRSRL
jgi:hypothetical protein